MNQKNTEERAIEYIFITALALIILSAVFFVFELLVGHYKLHLTLLNNNLPFTIGRGISLLLILLMAPVFVISLLFYIMDSKENSGSLPDNGFKASSLLFLVEFFIISVSYYLVPSASSTIKGFNNLDYALYYSIWTSYIGFISVLPPLVIYIFLNLYKRPGTGLKLFYRTLNIRQSFIISLPIALISDIVWSNTLVEGIQYYLLFYAVSILFMAKGPVIGTFGALVPLETDIMAYSFFGVLEIPFIFLTFILILAGFLQLFSLIPNNHKDNGENEVQQKPVVEKKIEKEKPSWINGKCPNCGHSAFLIRGSRSEDLVCQNCGYEFNKF